MPENENENGTESTEETVENATTETPEGAESGAAETDPEGADALQDPGKKALDSMKSKWHGERDKRRELERRVAELEAPAASGDGDQPDADAIRAQAERDALTKVNARILRTEVRAAAKGVLADPADAYKFLDMAAFEVDADGNVDADEIADALQELIAERPYLAAAPARRFQGSGDGGAARKATGPVQLSRSDLEGMSAAEITKAKREGRLADLLSGKN